MSGNNPLLCFLQGSWAEVKMVTLKEEPSVPASSQHGKVSCLVLTLPQWSTFSESHLLLAQWPLKNCPRWFSQSPPPCCPQPLTWKFSILIPVPYVLSSLVLFVFNFCFLCIWAHLFILLYNVFSQINTEWKSSASYIFKERSQRKDKGKITSHNNNIFIYIPEFWSPVDLESFLSYFFSWVFCILLLDMFSQASP